MPNEEEKNKKKASDKKQEEEFINPIDPEKIAEDPGLLPYAHNVGGVPIKPEDKGKIKGRSVSAMRQQTNKQMQQLYDQMQTLAKQARDIKDRISISEMIYEATVNFEPLIGHTYYLYEKSNGTRLLSLVAPEEWGKSMPYQACIAKVALMADHTWDVDMIDGPGEAQ